VRALVVWEPIIATDVVRPTSNVLGRVRDLRATQVWDPRQLIAKHMKQSASPQMQPECCDEEGIWWDLIAVYPPGALWEGRLPAAAYINGTVVDVSAHVADVIGKLASGRSAGNLPPSPGRVPDSRQAEPSR
jgi:hypothetical protein